MNKWDTTSYIGVTSVLPARTAQHKAKVVEGFTKKYNINKLVYYEVYGTAYGAIVREKQLKRWSRKKKVDLIKKVNPNFKDLSQDWKG